MPQPNNMAPGTVNLPIQTSGVVAGFATNTASAPAATGVACVTDAVNGGTSTPENYEMAPYTVTDGTHLQLTMLKPHAAGAMVAMGGLCGYGVEQTVDSGAGFGRCFRLPARRMRRRCMWHRGDVHLWGGRDDERVPELSYDFTPWCEVTTW